MIGDLRQMWRLLALSPARVAVAIAWGVAALGSGLGLAALAAWLIARAWQMPPVLDLSVAVVAVRALGISRGLCRYLERLATHDVALRAMTTARTSVYRTLAQSDVWWWRDRSGRPETRTGVVTGRAGADRSSGPVKRVGPGQRGAAKGVGEPQGRAGGAGHALRRGDVLVRIGADIDDLGAVVVRVLVPVAVAVVLSLAAVGLIATISPLAAVILAVALGVSGILAPWLSAVAARDAERAVRADRAEFAAEGLTVLDHAAELRVAGRLDAALAVADRASQRAVISEDSAASRSAWAAAATPLSIGISAFGALLVGIAAYGPTGGLPGGMTPMALTILVLVPLSAFEAVGALPAAATALTTSRAALHRLRGVSAEPHGTLGADGGGNARREWAADEPAEVDRRSAAAPEPAVATGGSRTDPWATAIPMPTGRRVVVVGPSGAGKTTLLMVWAGLFGTPKDRVTFFAEDAHLFGTSILENLRVARGDLTLGEAESALRAVGLGAWLASLPEGVHTTLTAGAAAVSGGQRRRILLARALVAPAHTLLLDEPTEHLAAAEGDQLLRDLLDANSGLVAPDRTVVVVTHQLPAGHHADTVVTVDASGRCTVEHLRAATK
ncbi:thiol reductant ABC exporter subunit CydC [Nocardia fluminea]|uniref:ATP-binding cassette subfamily C protein CydC n=1 Tax=Nocardia fluminea TaxID=134984 RepID=A0A2N3V8X9_9NOCA|nr:thiol reductant ABC exporter subunit CydC [Nocardia fluminea]PKV78056.1 ATP-binding cassette subfamily C protein CydC [Nocardia fluminea]